MDNTNDYTGKDLKERNKARFLEPIPVDSFIRHKLLKLFIDCGLGDFSAQILLSIILHGGQIKPATLAKDIYCNPSRLELPDGFPNLINLNLIAMSHNRPKTVLLAQKIDDLIERISKRTLVPNNLLRVEDATKLLHRLENYSHMNHRKSRVLIPPNEEYIDLLNYFTHLAQMRKKFPSLFSFLNISFSSLWMNELEALILAQLISNGGQISKRDFYLKEIKNFDPDELYVETDIIKKDLTELGYIPDEVELLSNSINTFHRKKYLNFKPPSEHQFNLTLNNLHTYCQSSSMGKKGEKRKSLNLTLIRKLSQIADALIKTIVDFNDQHESEIHILQMAYSNVKLVDSEIFVSSIADPSSTRKRLETDLRYATQISMVLIHSFFLEDLFLKIFDSENHEVGLDLLVAEELKEVFLEKMKVHKTAIEGKRGMITTDMVTFSPADEIPQDILIGNTLILFYDVGSSMVSIHEEITKKNPTEINTIPFDVNFAFKRFTEIKTENSSTTKTIASLISEKGI